MPPEPSSLSGSQSRAITVILESLDEGGAGDDLLPLVYGELQRIARMRMARERVGQTLQPTALVHEAYLRLLGGSDSWNSRAHFFGAAAEAMRRILIERARSKARVKRGGEYRRTTIDGNEGAKHEEPSQLLDLDRSLSKLEAIDPEMAEVVKLRYFAGFTVSETAEILDTSPRGVNRKWTAARAWLLSEMSSGPQGASV